MPAKFKIYDSQKTITLREMKGLDDKLLKTLSLYTITAAPWISFPLCTWMQHDTSELNEFKRETVRQYTHLFGLTEKIDFAPELRVTYAVNGKAEKQHLVLANIRGVPSQYGEQSQQILIKVLRQYDALFEKL